MMKKIKILAVAIVFTLAGFGIVDTINVAALSPAHMVMADLQSDAQNGLDQVGGGGTSINGIIKTIVNVLSIVVGIVAVIVVILSGFRYITSAGDSAKISSAKTTLIYALVGLAIAAVAQFLVHYALNTALGSQPCHSNSAISASDPKCK